MNTKLSEVKWGQRFGLWTFIGEVMPRRKPRLGRFICVCGRVRVRHIHTLRRGQSKSCGWHFKGDALITHGECIGGSSKEYGSWRAMLSRCYNPKNLAYHHYGGRGIVVCERWRNSVMVFIDDMGRAPSPKHTVDRIDNDGNYEPSNCRWATRSEQVRNRRIKYKQIEFQGESMLAIDWERRYSLPKGKIRVRLRHGWSLEKAILTPLKQPLR